MPRPREPKPKDVEAALRLEDDGSLCDSVYVFLVSGEEVDVSTCGEPVRVVVLVWNTMGLIGNGGFEYLLSADYPGDPGFVFTAAAHARIGAMRAYRIFQEVLAWFPPYADHETRRAILAAMPDPKVRQASRRYWDEDATIVAGLATYVREHRDDLARVILGK